MSASAAGRRYAVVGAGLAGLRAAQRLSDAGGAVTLFEAAPELGGLASAWTLGDVVWDRHYHVTLLSDAHTRGVMADLGLDDDARWVVTKTGFYARGRLSPMSNALEYLRLPALSMVGKARLAGTIVYASRVRDWRTLERTPVERWLTKLSGRATFENLWRPLLRAKLGEEWPRTSAAFLWATIQRLYAARQSGIKREMFGYVRGGYARLLEAYGAHLVGRGVQVRTSTPVTAAQPADGGWTVEAQGVGPERFDALVLTGTPRAGARLVGPHLPPDERARWEGVEYQGVVCASLLLSRPLAGYYLTYLTDEDLPFTAVVEMTAMVDPAELKGRHLVYLPRYVAPDDPLFDEDDASIRARFLAGLRRVHPDLREDEVQAFRVARTREVFPLPVLGYSERIPAVCALPGLCYAGSAGIVNGTLNVNETLAHADRCVDRLLGG